VAAKTAAAFPGLRRRFPKTYLAYKGAEFLYRHRKKALAFGASALGLMSARRGFKGPVTPSQAAKVAHMQRRYEARMQAMGRTRKPIRLARGAFSGSYKGALPRPKRPAKPGKYAMSGARAEVEKHGVQSLQDVVYLGAQAAPAFCVGNIVGQALIRKLMKIHHRVEYEHPSSQLVPSIFFGTMSHSPYSLKFINKTTLPNSAPTYNLGATFLFESTSTLLTFGAWFATNVFDSSTFGGVQDAAFFTNELYAYQFTQLDRVNVTTGAEIIDGPIIPLEHQYLTMYSTVRMHIQNVTAADSAGGDDKQADRIDNNPLKGKLFRFSGPLPKLNAYRGIATTLQITPVPQEFAYQLQRDTNADGIIMPSTALQGVWSQIPNASQFSNCTGELNVNLEPGAMRDYTITFQYSGTLQRLMRGFSGKDSQGRPRPNGVHAFGDSFVFALEKRMPTGALVNPTINFQYEQYYGACLGGRKHLPMARMASAGTVATADP